MKKLSLAVIAISTAMLSTSCLREDNFGKADSKFISLKVSTEGIVETKAGHVAEPIEVVDLSQDGLDLFLYGSVKVNKMSPFGPSTKATKPYESGDKSEVTTFDIKMNGIQGYADRSKGSDFWYIYRLGTEEKLTWESETDPSEYLAYYPENVKGATTNVASFASSSTINYVGDGTKDFLVAYTKHSHDHANYPVSDDKYVSLTFKHPLALVKFNIVDVEVEKIVINNVATSGVIDAKTLVPEKLDAKSNIAATADESSEGVCYSLYVMPDDIGADAINVTFYLKSGKILTTAKLGTTSWNAGYIYNYTLSNTDKNINHEVDIELSENPKEAESVVVENQKNTTLWLRAAVIANSIDANGRIDGVWTGDVPMGSDKWKFDGQYYYYSEPVIGYQAAEAVLGQIPTSVNGLLIGVAVQAIEYDGTSAEEAFAALN